MMRFASFEKIVSSASVFAGVPILHGNQNIAVISQPQHQYLKLVVKFNVASAFPWRGVSVYPVSQASPLPLIFIATLIF
jgi:hypothetical protein